MKKLVTPEIQELRRLADDAEARSAAKWAGAAIAAEYGIKGMADPAYIANVIEAELVRHESAAPGAAPIIEREWKRKDPFTGLSSQEYLDYVAESGASPAAQSAAIRIVGSYSTVIARATGSGEPGAYGDAVATIAEAIQEYLDIPEQPPEVTAALDAINAHRRSLGMSPLDPVSAGWTAEDVVAEAERIVRLPNLGRLMP